MTRSNSTSEARRQDLSDAVRRRVERLGAFGVDDDGRSHHYDPRRNTVFVTDDGDVVHVEDLDATPQDIDDWREFVDWTDEWFRSDDLTDATERHGAATQEVA